MQTEVANATTQPGRRTFILTSTLWDEHRQQVACQRATALWRDPSALTESRRNTTTPPSGLGLDASLLHARYDLEQLRLFGRIAGASDPIHVDPIFAEHTRSGRNVVQGRLALTLITRLLL